MVRYKTHIKNESAKYLTMIVICFTFFACCFTPSMVQAAETTTKQDIVIKYDNKNIEDANIDTTLSGVLNEPAVVAIANVFFTILNPLAVCAFGMAILSIVFSTSQRKTESSLTWIKSIIVTFVITNSLGIVFQFISSIILTTGIHTY